MRRIDVRISGDASGVGARRRSALGWALGLDDEQENRLAGSVARTFPFVVTLNRWVARMVRR